MIKIAILIVSLYVYLKLAAKLNGTNLRLVKHFSERFILFEVTEIKSFLSVYKSTELQYFSLVVVCVLDVFRIFAIKNCKTMITTFETIDQFNREYGIKTLHPLISITKMEDVKPVRIDGRYSFNFYLVCLKDSNCGNITYGRNSYDYQDGTLLFFAPGQVMSEDHHSDDQQDRGWALMFHPDLLHATSLGAKMNRYTFFHYEVNEALHLSQDEREIIVNCFHNIRMELNHAIDSNSKELIVSNLELFLNYCKRFYERQFLTRSHAKTDTLSRFEQILDNYFASDLPRKNGLPTAKYCAERMNMSVNYLSDLLREETGKSTIDHIHLRLIEAAKMLLSTRNDTVSEIAYALGFEYPQYFSRLFKKKTGVTPAEFRMGLVS